ncbi:MAG: hypothetical protein LBT09_06375 [Planctomycetaceae bacterium]|jgi:hypothetical protein|nr:hypothetical protein [Planctomycetaceae bacterium]
MKEQTIEKYDVLKELRKIRKKHYKETKNMSMDEHMEYIHQKSKEFREELSKIDISDGKYTFPFLQYTKTDEKTT